MDARQYYAEVKKVEDDLDAKFPSGEVPIFSLRNRDRGSTEGAVCTASTRVAARTIVDQTHRVATSEEHQKFIDHQELQRIRNTQSEQNKAKQVMVVMSPTDAMNLNSRSPADSVFQKSTAMEEPSSPPNIKVPATPKPESAQKGA